MSGRAGRGDEVDEDEDEYGEAALPLTTVVRQKSRNGDARPVLEKTWPDGREKWTFAWRWTDYGIIDGSWDNTPMRKKFTGTSREDCWAQQRTFMDERRALEEEAKAGRLRLSEAEARLDAQAARWLEHLERKAERGDGAPGTVTLYRKRIALALRCPALREGSRAIRVASLRRADITAYDVWLRAPGRKVDGGSYSLATVSHALVVLKACLSWCATEFHTDHQRSPFDGFPMPTVPRKDYRGLPLAVDRFRSLVWETRYGPLYVAILGLGLRIGEVVGLSWDDLREEQGRRIFLLHRQVRREVGRGLQFAPLKGRGDARKVPVGALVLAALEEERRRQGTRRGGGAVATTRWDSAHLIFRSNTGTVVDPSRVNRVLKATLLEAGLGRITPHDLRHFFVTAQVDAGVPLAHISRHVGHASVSTTDRMYNHSSPADHPELAANMDRLMGGGE